MWKANIDTKVNTFTNKDLNIFLDTLLEKGAVVVYT
jgi:hypothetical protein